MMNEFVMLHCTVHREHKANSVLTTTVALSFDEGISQFQSHTVHFGSECDRDLISPSGHLINSFIETP